jgi:ABC-type lipoprotein release transport system permease subunit
MKNLAVFAVFFIASFAIGATPILIGIALIYAVAWLLSRSTAKAAETPPAAPATPPPYGGTHRKIQP